jgi:hypothetical protein
MGEPEALDLELLKRGDNEEIRRAIAELGLFSLAQGVVYGAIGSRYESDVRVVACESIELLFGRAINTCRRIEDIRPMLAIARRRAINFITVAFRRWEISVGDELPGL